jgi:hypothetical protein
MHYHTKIHGEDADIWTEDGTVEAVTEINGSLQMEVAKICAAGDAAPALDFPPLHSPPPIPVRQVAA